MKPSPDPWVEEIRKAAPRLYRPLDDRPPHPFTLFGFETSAGWASLLLDLSRMLEAEIEAAPEADRERYVALQVKSKFGGLRFYLKDGTPRMYALIEAAEALSLATCETCGAPGERRPHRVWVFTACEAHAARAR